MGVKNMKFKKEKRFWKQSYTIVVLSILLLLAVFYLAYYKVTTDKLILQLENKIATQQETIRKKSTTSYWEFPNDDYIYKRDTKSGDLTPYPTPYPEPPSLPQ